MIINVLLNLLSINTLFTALKYYQKTVDTQSVVSEPTGTVSDIIMSLKNAIEHSTKRPMEFIRPHKVRLLVLGLGAGALQQYLLAKDNVRNVKRSNNFLKIGIFR